MTGSKDFGNLQKMAGLPAVAVVGGGCAATATQIIVLRECLALFYGSELTVGLVFFFWLFWTGAGSVVGGRLGPTLFPTVPERLRFVLVLVVIYGLLLPLTVLWVRASRSLFGVGPGELATFQCTVTLIAAVTAPVCVFSVFFSQTPGLFTPPLPPRPEGRSLSTPWRLSGPSSGAYGSISSWCRDVPCCMGPRV